MHLENVGRWVQQGNAWLSQNGLGQLAAFPGGAGVVWQGLPVFMPFVSSAVANFERWLTGGTMATPKTEAEAPPPVYLRPSVEALIGDIQSRSNLVAHAWKTTGARAESFYLLSQVSRVARLHPQMSVEAPSSQWIQAVRQGQPRQGTL